MNVNDLVEKAAAGLEAAGEKYKELDDRLREVEQKRVAMPHPASSGTGPIRKALAAAAKTGELQLLAERRARHVALPLEGSLRSLFTKALVNEGEASSSDGGYPSAAHRGAALANDPRRRLRLLDVLPHVKVTASRFEFVRLASYANAAAEQSGEGAEKAEASIPTELVTANIETVAHFLVASEQVLADTASLTAQLQDLLLYGVQAKAEALIIAGTGGISGLTEQATTFVPTATEPADILGEAEAALLADGWSPGLVILHPSDWQSLRAERATDGQYVFAGGWSFPAQPSIWGLPVVTSPSLTPGTALVLDPAQVAILDRQQAVVEAFREDSDNVRRNLVTIRAEARLGLAVYAAGAVLTMPISFGSSSV